MVRPQQLSLLALLFAAFWGCSDSASTAGWEHTNNAVESPKGSHVAERSRAFVSATDVFEALANDSDWVVVDVRKAEEYAIGHIPSAHRIWRNDIESTAFPYGGMAIEKEALEDLLSSMGATSESKFVVYDAIGGCDAARLWWLIRFYGHQRVALLDGGWQSWVERNHPAVQAETLKNASEFTFEGEVDSSLVITKAQLIACLGQPNVVLLDTRTLEEFNGSVKKNGAFAAGHIAGSVHFDWGRAVELEGDYHLRSPEAIQAALAEVGVTPDQTVITYCHSGVRSAHTTLVLRELLGFQDVRNYDGSWIEWSYALQLSDDARKNELQ
jgi:thiosulfate/3-mercaptopyruvate sulfurtransferase